MISLLVWGLLTRSRLVEEKQQRRFCCEFDPNGQALSLFDVQTLRIISSQVLNPLIAGLVQTRTFPGYPNNSVSVCLHLENFNDFINIRNFLSMGRSFRLS